MSKGFFQTPIKAGQLKPIELPENTDLNAVTDETLRNKAKIDAELAEGARKFGEELLASRIKDARQEIADAEEAARKAQWHERNAKKREEEAAQLAIGRQLRLKRKLADLTATCISVQSILDAIEDKNAPEITLFKTAITTLHNSFNK